MKGKEKDPLRGKDATEDDIIGTHGLMDDPMPLPPATEDEEPVGGQAFAAATEPEAPTQLDQLVGALQALLARTERTDTQDSALTLLAGAVDRMTAAQLEGADRVARATKTASRPSNEMWPQISAFNMRGDKDVPAPAAPLQDVPAVGSRAREPHAGGNRTPQSRRGRRLHHHAQRRDEVQADRPRAVQAPFRPADRDAVQSRHGVQQPQSPAHAAAQRCACGRCAGRATSPP